MSPSCVLITGANRGIGLALAKRFLAAQTWTVLACCRKPNAADELQGLKRTSGDRLEIHALDVTDAAAVAALSEKLSGRSIDILINNAGVIGGERQSAFDMDYDVWLETLKINTMGPLRMAQSFIDHLKRADQPRIATISSQMGSLSRKSKGSYAYRSSKAAVNKVMQVLALDLEDDGVIVSMLHPGWVRTDMGGESADIAPQDSAAGLFDVITSLEMKHTGRFLTYTGEEHPW